MTDEEQKAVRGRAVAVMGCAVCATVALPAISVNYETRHAEAEFRADVTRFATATTSQDRFDARTASSLVDHPWMVSVEYALEGDVMQSLTRYGDRYRDTAALDGVASFDTRHFERAELTVADYQCLSEAVYYEARSESLWGQLAVAEVVLNRVADHRYPNSVCDVVYQGSERTTGCQFSFTCDGSLNTKPRGIAWDRAKQVSANVLLDLNEKLTGEATHYHATYVNPVWNSGLIKTTDVGLHIFYRFPRGAEWQMVRERQERRVNGVMVAVSAERDAERQTGIVPASAQSTEPKPLRAIQRTNATPDTAAPAP